MAITNLEAEAIVPEGVARTNPDVVVRKIEVDVKRQVGLAYSAAQPPSNALQDFIVKLEKQGSAGGPRRTRS